MSEPDILLSDSETTIVQQLQLVGEEGGEPSITVDPFDEQLLFGQIEEGETRSEVSPALVESDRLRGLEVELGGGREYDQEGRCRVYRGGDLDLEPQPGVDITGGGKSQASSWPAGIVIYDDGERGVEIGPDEVGVPSAIQIGRGRGPAGEGGDGPPTKEGSEDRREPDFDYVPGTLEITGDTGADAEADTAVEIRGASDGRDGANLSLFSPERLLTADIDAAEGRLTLGTVQIFTLPTQPAVEGVSGTLRVNDGTGTGFDVTASGGTLSIEVNGGDAVFEIDSNAEEIRTSYSVSEGVL
jgi:hypothetical protein